MSTPNTSKRLSSVGPFSRLRRRARASRAFTLIELLVVILIIAVLLAVALPSFLGQATKAQDSAARQYLSYAYTNGQAVWTDNDGKGWPIADADGKNSLFAQLGAAEPEEQFGAELGLKPSQIAVVRLNEDAIVYAARSQSGTTFCMEVITQSDGAINGETPGTYWASGPSSSADPCGADATWGTPSAHQDPIAGHYPLPEPVSTSITMPGGGKAPASVPVQSLGSDGTVTLADDSSWTAASPTTSLFTKNDESTTGGGSLYEIDDQTGATTLLVSNANGPITDPVMTPDRKGVIFVQDGSLWETQAVCGSTPPAGMSTAASCTPTQVTAAAGAISEPAVAPDGNHLAWVSENTIYVWTKGQGIAAMPLVGVQDEQPRFSPDSSKLAYVSLDSSGFSYIDVVNIDGTGNESISQPSGCTDTSIDGCLDTAPVWVSATNIEYIHGDPSTGDYDLESASGSGFSVSADEGRFNIFGLSPTDMALVDGGADLLIAATDNSGHQTLYLSPATALSSPKLLFSPGAGYAVQGPAGYAG